MPTTISRLRFTGEKEYAAGEIQDFLRNVVDERTRRNIVAVLAGLETRGAESLTGERWRPDPDSAVRMYAAQGLGRLQEPQGSSVLLPLLEDKSSGVRKESAQALGASRNPAVGKDADGRRQEGARSSRCAPRCWRRPGQSGDAKQMPALKEFLNSDSESTRFAAAKGLCQLGSPDGFAFANKLLGARIASCAARAWRSTRA